MPTPATYYRCDVCGGKFETVEEALTCEQLPADEQTFHENDLVYCPRETRVCAGRGCYGPKGKIIAARIRRYAAPSAQSSGSSADSKPETPAPRHCHQYQVAYCCWHGATHLEWFFDWQLAALPFSPKVRLPAELVEQPCA